MLERKQRLALLAAFVILAAVAAMGWMRKTDTAFTQTAAPQYALANSTSPTDTANGYVSDRPAPYVPPNQPPALQLADARLAPNPCGDSPRSNYRLANYTEDRYYSTVRRPVYVHAAPSYRPAVTNSFVDNNSYSSGRDYRETVRNGRSTGKSVAIVAGTAGAGAAIGAVAGGGKGAGIGALSGGAAGFLYDRLTHNH